MIRIIFCRYLYWTDAGQFPKIEMCYLDGSNRKAVVTNGVLKPSGITIDISTNDVYFTDSSVDAIQVRYLRYLIVSIRILTIVY